MKHSPELNTALRRGRRWWAQRWAAWRSWADRAEQGRGRSQWRAATAAARESGPPRRPAARRPSGRARQAVGAGQVARSWCAPDLIRLGGLILSPTAAAVAADAGAGVHSWYALRCAAVAAAVVDELAGRCWWWCWSSQRCRPDSRWPELSAVRRRWSPDCPRQRRRWVAAAVAVDGRCFCHQHHHYLLVLPTAAERSVRWVDWCCCWWTWSPRQSGGSARRQAKNR